MKRISKTAATTTVKTAAAAKIIATSTTATVTPILKAPVKRATRKATATTKSGKVAAISVTTTIKPTVKRISKTAATATATAAAAERTTVKTATTLTTNIKPKVTVKLNTKASSTSSIKWTTIPANKFSKLKKYFCYFIISGNKTYNGYTVDLTRRLRQHNGIIQGGAKSTRCGKGGWEYLAVLTAPNWTAVRAMQVEWLCKYPTRKKPRPRIYSRPLGRIKSLGEVCSRLLESSDTNLELHLKEEYYNDFIVSEEASLVPSFITICSGFHGLKIG